MRIVLFAAADISYEGAKTLEALGHEVMVIIPKNRWPSVAGLNWPQTRYLMPEKFDDSVLHVVRSFSPDLILSLVFGLKIPSNIYTIPPKGAFNIHPSPLPEVRSANVWYWVVRLGLTDSAITTHRLTDDWDRGDIVFTQQVAVSADETAGQYWHRIKTAIPDYITQLVRGLETDDLTSQAQNEHNAHYYGRVKFRQTLINWAEDATEIDRQIRAGNPFLPGQTRWGELPILVYQASLSQQDDLLPGNLRIDGNQAWIGTGSQNLKLDVLYNKTCGVLTGSEFLNRFGKDHSAWVVNVAEHPAYKPKLDVILG